MTKSNLGNEADYLDRLMNEHQAAEFLSYSVRALQNWRVRGGGPLYVKVSARSIRYRRRDLIAWAEGRLTANTSAQTYS
ncbi:MAG: helix-turn-helix transcriptional regulator [Parvibaculaceae bacterium]